MFKSLSAIFESVIDNDNGFEDQQNSGFDDINRTEDNPSYDTQTVAETDTPSGFSSWFDKGIDSRRAAKKEKAAAAETDDTLKTKQNKPAGTAMSAYNVQPIRTAERTSGSIYSGTFSPAAEKNYDNIIYELQPGGYSKVSDILKDIMAKKTVLIVLPAETQKTNEQEANARAEYREIICAIEGCAFAVNAETIVIRPHEYLITPEGTHTKHTTQARLKNEFAIPHK